MPALRLVFPGSALLVLGLCWSLNATQTERRPPPGFPTNYITPVANLSVDELVGRWYVAEYVSSQSGVNVTAAMCLVHDFFYDDNGTLTVDPVTLLDGARAAPKFTFPVNENGVWDAIRDGVYSSTQAVVDFWENRFLAVSSCGNRDCGTFVAVRHIEDAGHRDELTELHRRLALRGINGTDGFVNVTEGCRTVATAAPDVEVQNGPSPFQLIKGIGENARNLR